MTRSYRSLGDRKRAVAMLIKRGFNYFVGYIDASPPSRDYRGRYGLSFGKSTWVTSGAYVKDIDRLVH